MLSGQCDAGKVAFRKALEATKSGQIGPERMDDIVKAEAAQWCRGANMGDKDKYAVARGVLTMGGNGVKRHTVAECQGAVDTVLALHQKITKADDSTVPEKPLVAYEMLGPACLAKAGDCAAAWKAYQAIWKAKGPDDGFKAKDEKGARTVFENLVSECKGK